jgi:hypothetical protein
MGAFELFQVETVNMTLMNVRDHQNCATMAYVSIVWVCIIQRNVLLKCKNMVHCCILVPLKNIECCM